MFAVPAALAGLVGRKRTTDQPAAAEPEERGFYRVSGRKLPSGSVLQGGGDGYGDEMPGNTLSGSSFYRDSQGFYGGSGSGQGPGSPTLAPPGPLDSSRPISGIPIMRPSPARTPVTEHPFAFGPSPQSPTLSPTRDLAGRSLVSQDGSHTSRFTEEV